MNIQISNDRKNHQQIAQYSLAGQIKVQNH